MRSIEQSLLRMGLDRLDIVLIHDCDIWTHGAEKAPIRFKEAMDGAYRALDKLRNEKVISAIGVGVNESPTATKFAKAGDFDVTMLAGRYSLLVQNALDEFLPLAHERKWASCLQVYSIPEFSQPALSQGLAMIMRLRHRKSWTV